MSNSNQVTDGLLTEENKKELENQLKQIEQQNLNDEDKAIEYSLLYPEFSQLNEAIKAIEKPASAGSKNPRVHLILADLLSIERSYSLAIKSYEKAIETASKSQVCNSQEISIVAQIELANCWLEKAQQELESLPKITEGDLRERLTELLSKQQTVLAARRGGCPNECIFTGQNGDSANGEYRWVGGMKKCSPCNF